MAALDTPTPSSELEAINTMLRSIKEAPINSLTGTFTTDVATARSLLSATLREVQAEGWHFNTEEGYPLLPDEDGNIYLPSNIIVADTKPYSRRDIDPVVRGQRLYDRKARTYTFTQKVEADIVLNLPFDELPEPVRWYCIVMAVRRYQRVILGSETDDGFNADDEARARTTMEHFVSDTADYTIFDNYAVARVLRRGEYV